MIKKVAVIGAGTMGYGIALSFSQYGYEVNLYDQDEEIKKSAPERIRGSLKLFSRQGIITRSKIGYINDHINLADNLESAVKDADFVMEAITEDLNLKQELFKKLGELCMPETIIASDTSSFKLKDIIKKMPKDRQKKCLVAHWLYPPHIVPLIELSHFGNMSKEDFDIANEIFIKMGKKPIKVLKDTPGMIAHRLQAAVLREAFYLYENGHASFEDIEKALTYGPAFRWAAAGFGEVMDMGGLDTFDLTTSNLFKELDDSQEKKETLSKKVAQGKLGAKTGEGFYEHGDNLQTANNKYYNKLLVQLEADKKNNS